MFGHLPELFIILVIALIVFGPEKLPEVAANAGRMYREVREAVDSAMHPLDIDVPDDFTSYYHESLARAGEDIPMSEHPVEALDPAEEYEPDDRPVDFHAAGAPVATSLEEDLPPTAANGANHEGGAPGVASSTEDRKPPS